VNEDECNQSLQCIDGHLMRDCYHYSYSRGQCQPSCTPNYQYALQRVLGYFEVDDVFSYTCQLYEADIIRRYDANECNGGPGNYYFCSQGPIGGTTQQAYTCCYWYYCGGQTCQEWDGTP
jgi:hypothetical protein